MFEDYDLNVNYNLVYIFIGGMVMNKRVRNINVKRLDKPKLIKVLLVVLSISIFVLLAFYFNSVNVSADNPVTRKKQVTSLRIEKGDTLWSIAQEYRTEEYDDINEYIDEIKASNGLFTDIIHEGNYIIVPYYRTVDAYNDKSFTDYN